MLLVVVTLTWLLWGAGALLQLEAEKLEGKRPPDAGCSLAPIIPFFPLGFFGIAKLVDLFADPWGSSTIFWLHVALATMFAAGIARYLYRGHSAKSRQDWTDPRNRPSLRENVA